MAQLIPLAIVTGLLLAACDSRRDTVRPQADALVAAAALGDAAGVRRALDAGVDINARDAGGRTAVTAAAMRESVS